MALDNHVFMVSFAAAQLGILGWCFKNKNSTGQFKK
jgi:hypothetical protein